MVGAGRNRGLRYLLNAITMMLVLGAVAALPAFAEAEQTPIYGVREPDEESIYEDDKNINYFLKQLNRAFPDYEVKPDNIEKLFYLGQEHDDQVYVKVMETRLIVSDLSEDDNNFRVSIFWAYSDEDVPEIDEDVFIIVLKAMNGNLAEDEIVARWKEAGGINDHVVRWDDDILFNDYIEGYHKAIAEPIIFDWVQDIL